MRRLSRGVLLCALLVSGLVVGTAPALAGPMFTPALGSPFATGPSPFSVAFSPDGKVLATANYVASTVSVFSVGVGGALTPVSGSPFATGKWPSSVAFSPDGKLLATANSGDNTLSLFSVGAGGALTPVLGSPFATGPYPTAVAFSPGGGLLATSNVGDPMNEVPGTVSVFSVGAGGALTPVLGSPFATGHHAFSMAFSPDGKLLATGNGSDLTVSVFSVSAGGVLTPVSGSPFTTDSFMFSLAFSPDGGLLATANTLAKTVSVFSVAAGGALSEVSGSPFPTGTGSFDGAGPWSVAFSLDGKLLTTANGDDNTASVFSVAAGGALTPVSGSPFATGRGPRSVAFSSSGLVATANAYDSTVSVFFHDTTPPTITGPGDLTAEATSSFGAAVSYAVSATDPDSPVASLVCDHPSGWTFPLGPTVVHCTATDPSGNSASSSFTVTVRDTTPPAITVPGTVTREAVRSSGAFVSYVVSAFDAVDGWLAATCTPASGSLFPVGTTTVTCTATDRAGNHASKQFDVVVAPAAAPVITVPGAVYGSAVNATGGPVTYTVSAYDAVDGPVTAWCRPRSGSWFSLGTTTVRCFARDKTGHIGTASFSVIVRDATPPVIRSAAMTAEAGSGAGATVEYGAVALDNVDGWVAASCTPRSGSAFPFGTTRVWCTAADKAGNVGYGGFDVVVAHTAGPVLLLPATITAEAAGPDGAKVDYTTSAYDAVDGPATPSCAPVSGSMFKLGVSVVTCTARDNHGYATSASFQILVRDTTAPTPRLPAATTISARGPKDAVVHYTASAVDLVDGAIEPTCKPASGSRFALGSTLVRCAATDKAHNTAVGSFMVTVKASAPWLTDVSQTQQRWVSGNALPHYAKAGLPVGTTFTYTLNQAARVTFAFTGTTTGRLVAGRCLPVTSQNRGNRACQRIVTASLRHDAHAGKNTLDFEGRLRLARWLPPGRYTVQITATAKNHRSYASILHFTIVR